MITENFGLATMDIYNNRTLNMTESIATRIDGFEHLIQDSANKLAMVAEDTWSQTNQIEGESEVNAVPLWPYIISNDLASIQQFK